MRDWALKRIENLDEKRPIISRLENYRKPDKRTFLIGPLYYCIVTVGNERFLLIISRFSNPSDMLKLRKGMETDRERQTNDLRLLKI